MDDNVQSVAHIHTIFFVKSETFIYHLLVNHKRFYPICLASRFVNLDQFPFPVRDSYEVIGKKFSIPWLLTKSLRRNIWAERVIKQRSVRLLHAHFGPNGVYALNLKKYLGIPLVTTFYGHDISSLVRKQKWLRAYRRLFEEGNLFLVEGLHMKSLLIKLGCPENKISIQRIPIPLEKVPFRLRQPKKTGEKIIFIFSGRFFEKKGLIYALEAVKRLKELRGDFEFLIIGDGPLKKEIFDFVSQNNMSSYVKLLGFLPYGKYFQEMNSADIFVQPSVTAKDGDSEGGAPTTILEAQAMGMPVVATYHADIPNVVIPGKSALLSQERDVEGIRVNLEFLLRHPEQWGVMGREGRAFVEKFHSLDTAVTTLEDQYMKLLFS